MKEKLRTLPRWLILLLDLSIICVSILVSFLLRYNFDVSQAFHNTIFILSLVVAINLVLFRVFKTYVGIIRYTNFSDAFRILTVNSLSSLAYFLIGYAFYDQGMLFIPRSVIMINFFTVTFTLIGYRVFVRYVYKTFFTEQLLKMRTKAVIYDTSEEGLLIKRLIADHSQSHIHVVAFIDDVLHKRGKAMEGLPIYGTSDLDFKRLQQEKVELLIIANLKIPKSNLNQIVENAMLHGIKVQQVPPVKSWLDGKIASSQLRDINIEDLLEREVIKIENEKVYHQLKGKKILITGAAGSIGSELVRQLIGYKPSLLILCDKAETPMHEFSLELKEKFPNASVRTYIGDICDKVRMEHLFEVYSPEMVYHAAAYKHVPLMEENPSVAVINNVLGTKNLAELAVAYHVEKFVMVSTDKAVNPTNIMGASKRIAEIFTQSYFRHLNHTDKMLQQVGHTTKFVTTRFGNVLGSNGSVIPRFKKQIEKGGPITITHPDITRYFMTIPEACQLVIEAGAMGNGGEIYVFDMGQPVKITDLAHKMIRLSGKLPEVDIKIVFTGLRPGEKLYEELLNDSENTSPTYHEKIMIAQVREYDFVEIKTKVEALLKCAKMHYTYETVALMKELVPEFISNNSAFESLDVKV